MNAARRDFIAGAFFILLAASGWGLLGPVARLAFAEGLSPLEVAFWRAVQGGVFFGLHAVLVGRRHVQRQDLPGVLLFALIGGVIFFAAYQMAVDAGGASLAAVLLYTAPVWVVLGSALFLKEPVTTVKTLAVAATLLGVVLIASGANGARYSLIAIILGLVSGFSYASYYLFGKLYFERYSAASVYAVVFPVAALGLFPWVSFSTKTSTAVAALLILGIASTYLPYLFYALGLRRMDASRASVIATTEPVIAATIAHLWWGERFSTAGYAGALLVLFAVVVMVLSGLRRRPKISPRETGSDPAELAAPDRGPP
ncbi:MAG: DMT family transporter [Bacteroidota bacterium]